MSLYGDLVYWTKGIEALYPRSQGKAIRIQMQISEREEENGIHNGFVPMLLGFGMGVACELAMQNMNSDEERIMAL